MRIRQHLAGTLNEWSVRQFISTSVNEGLKSLLGGLKMKLKPQDSVAIDKGLVLTGLTACQMKRPLGQVEGFPMPMKNLAVRRNESPYFMTLRLFRKLDWKPADLWLGVLVNLGAQDVCEELASETNPQDGLPGFDGLTDEVLLRLEPRILRLVMGTHWTSHHNQPVNIVDGGKRFIPIKLGEADLPFTLLEPRKNGPQALEGNISLMEGSGSSR